MVLTCVYTLVSTFFIYHKGEGMTTLKRRLHILLILLALTTTMNADTTFSTLGEEEKAY